MSTTPLTSDLEKLLAEAAWVRALAHHLCSDGAAAEDLAQEALLAAIERPPREAGSPRGWLRSVVQNLARQRGRRESARAAREHSAARVESEPSAHDIVERAQLSRRLVEHVLALEEPYRSTILERYFDGRTSDAIATREGVASSTVRARLQRGLAQLRGRLEREDGTEWMSMLLPLARIDLIPKAAMSPAGSAAGGAAVTTQAVRVAMWGGALKVGAVLGVAAVTAWIAWPRTVESLRKESNIGAALASGQEAKARPTPASNEGATVPPSFANAAREQGRSSIDERFAAKASISVHEMKFIVLDIAGLPIVGATVDGSFGDTDEKQGELSSESHSMTSVDGSCRVPVPETIPAEGFQVSVHAQGFLAFSGMWRFQESVTLKLPRATKLSGTITLKETGQAAAAARVYLQHSYCNPLEPLTDVVASVDGKYEFSRVAEDVPLRLTVVHEGSAPQHFVVTLQASASHAFDMQLDGGLRLRGRVVDLETEQAIANATVIQHGTGDEIGRTNMAGEFEARVMPPASGKLELKFQAQGFCAFRDEYEVAKLADEHMLIRLPKGVTIQARVLDEQGMPIEGANLGRIRTVPSVNSKSKRPDEQMACLHDLPPGSTLEQNYFGKQLPKTDDHGVLVLDGLLPLTKPYRLTFEHADFITDTSEPVSVNEPGSTASITIRMKRAPLGIGSIHGTLFLNDKPLPGRIAWKDAAREGSVETNSFGRFRLRAVGPGSVTLRCFPAAFEDFGTALGNPSLGFNGATVDLAPGSVATHDFHVSCKLAFIAGHVRSSSGTGLAKAGVNIADKDTSLWVNAVTASDGSYRIEVPDGPHVYRAMIYEGGPIQVREGLHAGDQDVDFVVAQFGKLRFRAVDAVSRAAIYPVDLYWRRTNEIAYDSDIDLGQKDAEGYRSRPMPLGTFELIARSDDGGYLPTELKPVAIVHADETTTVDFEMRRGLDLTLIRADASSPIPHGSKVLLVEESLAAVIALSLDEKGQLLIDGQDPLPLLSLSSRALAWDKNGKCVLHGLPAGRFRWKVYPDTLDVDPVEIDLKSPDVLPIRVSLRAR